MAAQFVREDATPVLDLGGGTGPLARLLHAARTPVVVADVSSFVAAAPRPAARADARRLPFADGSFGGVSALWMLNHLDEPIEALREIRRVLQPGGRSVFGGAVDRARSWWQTVAMTTNRCQDRRPKP